MNCLKKLKELFEQSPPEDWWVDSLINRLVFLEYDKEKKERITEKYEKCVHGTPEEEEITEYLWSHLTDDLKEHFKDVVAGIEEYKYQKEENGNFAKEIIVLADNIMQIDKKNRNVLKRMFINEDELFNAGLRVGGVAFNILKATPNIDPLRTTFEVVEEFAKAKSIGVFSKKWEELSEGVKIFFRILYIQLYFMYGAMLKEKEKSRK